MLPSRFNRFPMATTFSIVALDEETGEMGVAVQSHWFSVGSIVAWGRAGVGVIATQSVAEISYGPLGLALMQAKKSPLEALAALKLADAEREYRQVAFLNWQGETAVHTGKLCIQHAGHYIGDKFSTQANMMINPTVWGAMAEGFMGTRGDLADRLLAALEAGQSAGGDVRGMQSAVLIVVAGERNDYPWDEYLVNLRVEDHQDPISELRRLLTLHKAYTCMNRGDKHLSEGDIQAAMAEYSQAAELAPLIPEIPFWKAVTLADLGKVDEALPIFKQVFQSSPNLALLVQALPASNMLRDDPQLMAQILAQAPGQVG